MARTKKDPIQLSDHFTYGRLLRFTIPSILMMICMSIYSLVDGIFVSNFGGKQAFAAVNFAWPVIMILVSIGMMFGAGGSALLGKVFGEGEEEKAQRTFTMIVWLSVTIGVIVAILAFFLLPYIFQWIGAEGEMLSLSTTYGRILLVGLPAYIIQYEFQGLFNTAERPKLGLLMSLISGLLNVLLDGLLVGLANMGVAGAALASTVSQIAGAMLPVIYFSCKNKSILRFRRFKMDWKSLGKVCSNGCSEFVSNIAFSVAGIFYNVQLLKYAGEDGLSAYGALMYINLIFSAIFMGYAISAAPITSFHLGAGNKNEMKSVLKKSLVIISVCSLAMFGLSAGLSKPLAMIFASYDDTLLEMTRMALLLSSCQYVFMGLGMYGSSYFTALNNGLISAIIAFLRSMVFNIAYVFLIPMIWGLNGIWLSIPFSELTCLIIVVIFLLAYERKYGYGFWKKKKTDVVEAPVDDSHSE